MATIKDVAELAGVSVATVSRVINHSPKASKMAKETVTKAMHTLGYRPNVYARALVSQKTDTVGVLVHDVSDQFFGSIVRSVENETQKVGKYILIGNGFHDETKERAALERLISSRCDAFIVHSKALSDEELGNYAHDYPSMVFINRIVKGYEHRSIDLDNIQGERLATQHLIKNGHSDIIFICSSHHISDVDQRIAGFKQALSEANIPFNDNMIIYNSPYEEGGEKAAQELLQRGLKPTAIATYNDSMAIGVLSVLTDNGFDVPDDISLIGFDNLTISRYLHPRLTTINYPIDIIAIQATRLALSLVEGHAISVNNLYIPTLVPRYSVKRI